MGLKIFKIGQKFYDYLFQAVLIIFSVVLALVLNEYRKGIDEKADLRTTISNIRTEIKNNQELIDKLLIYHKESLERLHEVSTDEQTIINYTSEEGFATFKLMPDGVFPPGSLSNSAWEVAKTNSVISMLEVEKAQLLSRVYAQQETTLMSVMLIYYFATDRSTFRTENAKSNMSIFSIHLKELYGKEKSLLDLYNEALIELENLE